MILNKLKELLSELKKFKVQTILMLHYQKRNHYKISHSSVKLTATNSEIHKAFICMKQSIMTKTKNYARDDVIILY